MLKNPLSLLFAAALASSCPIALAQDRKDGGAGKERGQSERPADPKQAEPESSSHNADKPKTPTPASPGTSTTTPPSGQPVAKPDDVKK